jgi:hypothetical protein
MTRGENGEGEERSLTELNQVFLRLADQNPYSVRARVLFNK